MPLAGRSAEMSSIIEAMHRFPAFALYVVRRFDGDLGFRTASALTYTSLLSMVPLLAVSLAILAGFGVIEEMRQQVRETLLNFILPEAAGQVTAYFNQFLTNTRQLTVVGLVGLAITAVVTLATIEATFNRIWRAQITRPWPIRLLAFWAVLTLGPLLLGASISLTATVQAFTDETFLGALVRPITLIGPFLIQWAAFSLLYLVIPAKRVRILHALTGGAIAAVLFQILKVGFAIFVGTAENYRIIYGALAAFPIFLLWLYSFWTLLLIGAHVAAALPERLARHPALPPEGASAKKRLTAALDLLRQVWKEAGRGGSVSTSDPAAEAAAPLLGDLKAAGLIAEVNGDHLIAGGDFRRMKAIRLWHALDLATPQLEGRGTAKVLRRLSSAEEDILGCPLAELFSREAGT